MSVALRVAYVGIVGVGIGSVPSTAQAFCGFYVGGAGSELYNDATMVVMMRDGTKTVLSMQNDYRGPPENFALVVPVPEILDEENVKMLPKEIFQRVDELAAPRLVEYWEQNPCAPVRRYRMAGALSDPFDGDVAEARAVTDDTGVTVEAEFAVGEYDIVILSAGDSSGLERWLRREDYVMPDGAGEALAPYVRMGTKFFVAKVDPARVTFERGRAVLSPLRVHYDAETFALPIRLGLLNARGKQDLLVHILAKNARYDVANYPNVTIPTNLVVTDATRRRFGEFYRGLFDKVSQANDEGAVVTEYSSQATSCDPCPTTPLQAQELALLGADVIDGLSTDGASDASPQPRRRLFPSAGGEWTLTRLHHRYDAEDLDHDLVFRRAPTIVGGRGMPNESGELSEQTPSPADTNQFQGRYAILHRWTRAVRCADPQRGIWGGPPGGREPPIAPAPSPLREPRGRQASAVEPERYVSESDHPYLSVTATPATNAQLDYAADSPGAPSPAESSSEQAIASTGMAATPSTEPQPAPHAVGVSDGNSGCASCATGSAAHGGLFFCALMLFALRPHPRRQR